jgi:hypothetical protein
MTDLLESDLRATLHERAARVPDASIVRLRRLEYRPRTRAVTPPVAIGAVAGATAAAVAVVALIGLGAGASNAFAGWTPTPTPPAPAQLGRAEASCKQQSPVAGLPLRLSDTRGPFTFSVYADSDSSATCISGPTFTSVSADSSSAPVSIPPGQVLLRSSHVTNRDGQAYSFAVGHTGAGVSAVTLNLDDGTSVTATVENGWFVAWWPSAHAVSSADVTTPSGVKTQTFDHGRQSPCGAQPCAAEMSVSGGIAGHAGGGATSGETVVSSAASR